VIEDVYFLTVEDVVALASGLVFLHQNGVEIDDPGGVLYDVMIGAATKAIGKPEIAATLCTRSKFLSQ
jgi:prophage maintenance system killer protein